MFENSVIVALGRTAVGSFGGSLKEKTTVELGAAAIRGVLERAGIGAEQVDEVVLGCVGQYGVNAFLARLAALKAGCPTSTTGQTVNRLCASGLQAIITAAMMVENGDIHTAVAGGAESMSQYPYLLTTARWGMRMGAAQNALEDALTTALCEPLSGPQTHIAVTAENIAAKYGLTREALDSYALESQKKARMAIFSEKFKAQIIPVEISVKKASVWFDTDEHPRETNLEKLAALRPIVKADGVVTAGNSSGINDAAAAVVVMSRERAHALGLVPLARIAGYAVAGVDPDYMGMGPVASTKKLMNRLGMRLSDIGLVELNEAFAAQALACIQELDLDPALVNVNGSGISLGHPIGATGAVISVKLLDEMKRRGVQYGLATLCIGGGQGLSVLFEAL